MKSILISTRTKFLIFFLVTAPLLISAQMQKSNPDLGSLSAECAKNPTMGYCAELQKQKPAVSTLPEDRSYPSQDEQADPLRGPVLPQPISATKEEPTEFQQFIATSVGRELPVFGYDFFMQAPSTFAPVDRIPVTADYVIGPGDELLIRAWGQIDIDARVIVDRSGAIYIPRIGSLVVTGVEYQQLPEFLKTNIGRIFKNFELTVSLGQLRSVQVLVVGQARRPGVYTVSSLSTLTNALFASGGPSSRGSMRHIQLKRKGQTITDFDFYDLLLRGDKSKDVVVQSGDVIFIPPVGPQIAVFGSVKQPAIYELASTSTLEAQLETAGGLTNTADGARVIVERIDGRSVRKVDEFKLDDQGMSREVRDGDLVRVFPITPRFENAVTLRGNVAQPGRYPWWDGMRVRDLIPDRQFLLTRAFWEQQNLAAADKTFGATQEDAQRNNVQRKQGSDPRKEVAVSISNEEEEKKAEELKNDVKRNAPEINWEYAVIQRLDPVTLSTSLLPFNLGKAILESDDNENKLLQPGDIVTVFSQADISVGVERRSKFVRLEGEFRSPGIYKVEPGETLRKLVERAGGLTTKAYIFGSEFTRETVRKEQQRSLDEMIRSLEQEVQRKSTVAQSRPEQQSSILAQSQADQAFIEKLRAVKPSGRIVLELHPNETAAAELPELPLEDGDRFIVPPKSLTVTVVGAVYNQNSFLYKPGSPIKRYLGLAGKGTRMADSKHMFLIRADGSVISRDQVSSFLTGGFDSVKTLPGDMLVVPSQMDKGATMRGLKDWSQVISQFGLGVAAVAVFMN